MHRVIRFGSFVATFLAASALGPEPTHAQAETAKFEITDLKQETLEPSYRGKAAMVEGNLAPGEEDHFTLADISTFAPTSVTLIAKDPSKPVSMRFGKFGWAENEGGATTDSAGEALSQFRTQGDLLITVAAKNGGEYDMLVWTGDDVPPPMKPVLVAPSEADGTGWFGSKWLLALLAAIALGAGAWFLLKRRKAGKATP